MFVQLQRPPARMVSLVNEMEQRLPPALLRSYVVNGSTHGMHRTEELWTMEYRGTCGAAHLLFMPWWEQGYGFAHLKYRPESGFMLHDSWEVSTAQTQAKEGLASVPWKGSLHRIEFGRDALCHQVWSSVTGLGIWAIVGFLWLGLKHLAGSLRRHQPPEENKDVSWYICRLPLYI